MTQLPEDRFPFAACDLHDVGPDSAVETASVEDVVADPGPAGEILAPAGIDVIGMVQSAPPVRSAVWLA